MKWKNKMKLQLPKTKDIKKTNPKELLENSSITPKGENKTLNTVDSLPEKTSSTNKDQKSTSDDIVKEEINKHDISKDVNKNVTDQQTKFGESIYRDYNEPPGYYQISMENPFDTMPTRTKTLIDENRQIRSAKRIRNHRDDIEENNYGKRIKNAIDLNKTLLTDEIDYDEGFPGEYIFPRLEDISSFEDIENEKSKKLFVPKNMRSIKTRRLPEEETFDENLQKISKDLITETPDIFKDDESEMSGITENNEMNKSVDNKKTEVPQKGEKNNMGNEKSLEFEQKEHKKENNTKEKVVEDEKKETIKEAEKLEEKIKEAKEESKKEGQGTKMTEIFNKRPQNNKPISMSLPTSLETPEISRNLFDNNKNSNTVDNEKERGLNKKLIIEQINESEKQLVEIEDLTKNVKANLNKLKEELQAKKDDQRNIELNIIEVKQKTPEK